MASFLIVDKGTRLIIYRIKKTDTELLKKVVQLFGRSRALISLAVGSIQETLFSYVVPGGNSHIRSIALLLKVH